MAEVKINIPNGQEKGELVNVNSLVKKDVPNTLVDQSIYVGLTSQELNDVKEIENNLDKKKKAVNRELEEIAELLSEAHNIYSKKGNGNFQRWCESHGFKRTFVSLILRKREIAKSMPEKKELIYLLPDRDFADFSKMSPEERLEILGITKNLDETKTEIKKVANKVSTKELSKKEKEVKEKLKVIKNSLFKQESSDETLEPVEELLNQILKILKID